MSDRALILGGLLVAYLYMKRNGAGVQVKASIMTTKGAALPASVPATVGSGYQQMAAGALTGFLRGVAAGPANNTATLILPNNVDYIDRSDILQDAVGATGADVSDLAVSSAMGWA